MRKEITKSMKERNDSCKKDEPVLIHTRPFQKSIIEKNNEKVKFKEK